MIIAKVFELIILAFTHFWPVESILNIDLWSGVFLLEYDANDRWFCLWLLNLADGRFLESNNVRAVLTIWFWRLFDLPYFRLEEAQNIFTGNTNGFIVSLYWRIVNLELEIFQSNKFRIKGFKAIFFHHGALCWIAIMCLIIKPIKKLCYRLKLFFVFFVFRWKFLAVYLFDLWTVDLFLFEFKPLQIFFNIKSWKVRRVLLSTLNTNLEFIT